LLLHLLFILFCQFYIHLSHLHFAFSMCPTYYYYAWLILLASDYFSVAATTYISYADLMGKLTIPNLIISDVLNQIMCWKWQFSRVSMSCNRCVVV
jgi:hypothetical protein